MFTASNIRRIILKKTKGQLITTRECLIAGSRGAVDQALYKLVKNGFLERVAWGVFQLSGSPVPAVEELARVKADAFSKTILTHGSDAAISLDIDDKKEPAPTFACTGRSSSFLFILKGVRIRTHYISPRKMHLKDTRPGLLIRALWHMGKEACDPLTIQKACRFMFKEDQQDLKKSPPKMAAWMTQLFQWGMPPPGKIRRSIKTSASQPKMSITAFLNEMVQIGLLPAPTADDGPVPTS